MWLDDERLGSRNSLSVPHVYDLGVAAPGKHTLTICVDNTIKIPIGTWAHAITEDTQGNWNGIIGRIELRTTDQIWLRSVQVFPHKLRIDVGNRTGAEVHATVQSVPVVIPAQGGDLELPISPPNEAWGEFAPNMHQLTVELDADRYHDSKLVGYGVRELKTREGQFIVNGRPVLLRGPVDECVYPLTGYPPMDRESWLRILRICRSYGFNFMRFHSWCPPEAAFAAGDELGFLFQVELPLWTMDVPHFGEAAKRDEFIRDELKQILDTYGNHPSFGLMAMGNESSGALESLVQMGRARDPRRLFRSENGEDVAHGDYIEAGNRGILGPRTDWDRWDMLTPGWIAGGGGASGIRTKKLPTLAHEVGQWEMYPRLDEASKYSGTLRASYLDRYRDSLARHGMLDQATDFAEASGKLSVLLYKEEIEATLRTYPYGGLEILEARDYPGQGVASVGWLNPFWDSKGLITPEEFRQFCGPTVCLLRMPKRVLKTTDTFHAVAQISHFGLANLEAKPKWSISDERGRLIAKGELPAILLKIGEVTRLGEIAVGMANVPAPARLAVTVSAAGNRNCWNIWVYPAAQPDPPHDVVIVHHFDLQARNALFSGRSVLLFSSPIEGVIYPTRAFYGPDSVRALPRAEKGRNAIPGSFMPTFWNLQLFNQIGTNGMLCDPHHPAFGEFPTGSHSDWQWADLLGNFSAANSFPTAGAPESYGDQLREAAGDVTTRSKAIILEETPTGFKPIIQIIDNQERNVKLGSLFEARVGPGKLLVCALDLETEMAARPAAQQLRSSLLNYAAGITFAPAHELTIETLERLLC